MKRILAHIVLHNSPVTALRAVESLFAQDLAADHQLEVLITDNASSNDTVNSIEQHYGGRVRIRRNQENLGFAAAQNQAAADCVGQDYEYLFLANPDARFEPDVLMKLCTVVAGREDVAGATPLLFRADEQLEKRKPEVVDAAGMKMTTSLRHLDREQCTATEPEAVFGATGAAVLLVSRAIKLLALDCPMANEGLYKVYPQLRVGAEARLALFDEAFFAYREDADLAWRAQTLGLGFIFVPRAVGYHVRHVLPERRGQLSPQINRWSVRNRFLMQLNNFSIRGQAHCVVPGVIVRNLLVVFGVLLREWSSIGGLVEVVTLMPRALARRRALFARPEACPEKTGRWFQTE